MIGYGFDISQAQSSIKPGMTRAEVVERIGHQPDQVSVSGNETKCVWSTAFRNGSFSNFFGLARENGHYWLQVIFDAEDRVIRVSADFA